MSLAEELRKKKEAAIDAKAAEFAEKMKEKILTSAEDGYGGYKFRINRDNNDGHMLRSKHFAEKLEKLLDGVKVEYEVESKKSVLGDLYFHYHYLHFSWREGE